MQVIVDHGGIPEDYVGIRIEIPDDVEIGAAGVPEGWPDIVPEEVTAEQGTTWVNACNQAVLRVSSATMSISGYNYVLSPGHPTSRTLPSASSQSDLTRGCVPRD